MYLNTINTKMIRSRPNSFRSRECTLRWKYNCKKNGSNLSLLGERGKVKVVRYRLYSIKDARNTTRRKTTLVRGPVSVLTRAANPGYDVFPDLPHPPLLARDPDVENQTNGQHRSRYDGDYHSPVSSGPVISVRISPAGQ